MLCGMLLDNKNTCKALVPSALINMKNIINKFLLVGDKFMPEMHLRQPRFVYSACGLLLDIQNLKNTKNLNVQVIRVYYIEMN